MLHYYTILYMQNLVENVPFKAFIPQMGIDNTEGESIAEFIIKKIGN